MHHNIYWCCNTSETVKKRRNDLLFLWLAQIFIFVTLDIILYSYSEALLINYLNVWLPLIYTDRVSKPEVKIECSTTMVGFTCNVKQVRIQQRCYIYQLAQAFVSEGFSHTDSILDRLWVEYVDAVVWTCSNLFTLLAMISVLTQMMYRPIWAMNQQSSKYSLCSLFLKELEMEVHTFYDNSLTLISLLFLSSCPKMSTLNGFRMIRACKHKDLRLYQKKSSKTWKWIRSAVEFQTMWAL